MARSVFACLAVFFMVVTSMLCAPSAMAEARKPVSIEEGSPLPLRVLTRPKAVLYGDASEAKPIEGQLPVFKPFFVYTRPGGESRATGDGWYEVGTDEKGTIAGWIKTSDVFEWKQTMCLTFTHPQGRKPVLMFEEEEPLDALLKEMPDQRDGNVAKLYADIDGAAATPLPEDFPVISVEPKLAVDQTKQFYLLPILEHRTITMESYEGRMLRLAAVSGKADEKREKPSDIRVNQEALKAATATEEDVAVTKKDAKFDIVWVMDTTRSMQPYIEQVRNTLESMSKNLAAKPEMAERIKFGLVAYRDSEEIKDIGYLTKNFTPELQDVSTFVTTLGGVEETKTDSVDLNEDMFAGVKAAIENAPWREGSARFVIVVGDAPSHELGHKWNSTQLDEKSLRELATQNNVTVLGIHVAPKVKKKYNRLALKQFTALTTNKGALEAGFWSISSKDKQLFVEKSQQFTTSLAAALEAMVAEAAAAPATTPVATTAPEKPVEAPAAPAVVADKAPAKKAGDLSQEGLDNIIKAATVTWVGRAAEAQAPNDIEAWVTDKDLEDPSIQALEVNLLVTKRQLDSLAVMLNDIITAGAEAQMGSADFFTSLQAVSATASRNADQLAKAKSLQESGFVPAFLKGLPYESQIMTMSSELWESLGPDEQDQFIESLRAKVAAYQSIHSTPDLWYALNQGDAPDDHVTAIKLELLP